MTKIDARSILINDTDKDKLAETYAGVIEAIQKEAVSEQIKNKNYSGEPESGTVEIDRFKNAQIDDLGTARTSQKGKLIKNTGKVTVSVDTDKEIVEEISKKDIKLYGIPGMAERRKQNHIKKMAAYLDKEFFAKAEAEGTAITIPSTITGLDDKLELLIQSIETTVNDWVDGVDRDMIVMSVTPKIYGALKNFINKTTNSLTGFDENYFNHVRIYSNHRQTKDAICMIDGALAQLVTTDQYDVEKIPLSNDFALELFFSKGTKAVMPDLVKFVETL
jgi:hypothetical protein|nr:MAG TPA: major capsid protein [Caudoviricetes sp.]